MKKVFFRMVLSLFALLYFGNMGYGQGWAEKYDIEQNDYYIGIHPSPDGFYIVNKKNLVKTDTEGSIIWSKELEHPTTEVVFFDDSFVTLSIDYQNNNDNLKTKYSYEGELLWSNPMDSTVDNSFNLEQLSKTHDDHLLYFESVLDDTVKFIKTNYEGEVVIDKTLKDNQGENIKITPISNLPLSNGNIILFGQDLSGSFQTVSILFDSEGNFIWKKPLGGFNLFNFSTFSQSIETKDGNIILSGSKSTQGYTRLKVLKIDFDGNVLWEHLSEDKSYWGVRDILELESGNILITDFVIGPDFLPLPDYSIHSNLLLFSPDGDLLHKKPLQHFPYQFDQQYYLTHKLLAPNLIAFGGVIENSSNQNTFAFICVTDTLGNLYPYNIEGALFQDFELDCEFDGTEEININKIVKLESDSLTFYQMSNEGYFGFNVPEGNYNISIDNNDFWVSCESNYTASVSSNNGNYNIDIPLQPLISCPLLTVDLSTPFLRMCFDNYYIVNYCNQGTIPAEEATVEVTLADELEFLDASAPLLSQNGQVLTFDIGTVPINECGNFRINLGTVCDTALFGQTLCSEAHIFPDSICGNTWTGVNLEVEGVCENDSVKFTITNAGGDMPNAYEYIVIEDNIIMMQGDFQLNENEMRTESVEALSGATYHLLAAQDPSLPPLLGNPIATATVEGCVGPVNVGIFNQIPFDDGEPFLSTSCEEVIAAYDPNDKTPSPTGWSDENFIEARTELEYRIRFQNTGTDTAFRVVVVDTLSPFLDPASIRPGAASHPYSFDLSGNGVATFTFDDILLPDSTTNEAASNGFVNFKISQQPGNPIGTVIENTGHIYFDFNAPVLTNTTFHTIGEPWVSIVSGTVQTEDVQHQVRVFPNPFFETATFELEGYAQKGTLEIFDMNGRLVLSQDFAAGQAQIGRGQLTEGVYFFQMENEGGVLASGKVVVR